MSRALFWILIAAAVAAGLAFRLTRLDARPMHHDEANQAVRFGLLLESGQYRYDPNDHHGPTIYYLTLPSAWLRGQRTLAALDERTLRIVPAIFGVAAILALSLFAAGVGRTAAAIGALLAAISPALTYYSRFYIQESLFVFFALGFLIAIGRYALKPRMLSAVSAGLFAGLAIATKETSLIVLVTAAAACVIARRTAAAYGAKCEAQGAKCRPAHFVVGLLVAMSVSALFYSSLFANPRGLLDAMRASSIYVWRGVGAASHVEPWYYYLGMLSWSSSGGLVWTEALILALAVVGMIGTFRRKTARHWPMYVALYSLLTACAFSAIPYKTPWNLLSFHIGFAVLAGVGAARLIEAARSRAVRVVLTLVLVAAASQLALQNWRANFAYPADPRNPYVYAQTSPDFLRLAKRVSDLSAFHPDREGMLVKVVAGPYDQWPLPWYLRKMKHVGYWKRAGDAGALDGVPLIVTSQDNAPSVDSAVGERYVSEYYGLRPGTILSLYIERGLWERFLRSRQ